MGIFLSRNTQTQGYNTINLQYLELHKLVFIMAKFILLAIEMNYPSEMNYMTCILLRLIKKI